MSKKYTYFVLGIFIVFGITLSFTSNVNAASITYNGLLAGNTCGIAANWLAIRVITRDSATGNLISYAQVTTRCNGNWIGGGHWHSPCAPDFWVAGAHYDSAYNACRWGVECASTSQTSIGSDITRCMGGCPLPFTISVTAPPTHDSGSWVLNNQAAFANTFYPGGNGNRAQYTVRLVRQCTAYGRPADAGDFLRKIFPIFSTIYAAEEQPDADDCAENELWPVQESNLFNTVLGTLRFIKKTLIQSYSL